MKSLINFLHTKKGIIITALIAAVLLLIVTSTLVFSNKFIGTNTSNTEEIAEVESVGEEEEDEEEPTNKEESVPEEVKDTEVQSNVSENKSDVNNEGVKSSEVKKEQVKENNQPESKAATPPVKEKKSKNNVPVTYKSKSLGISFTMPANWNDNYYIEEKSNEVDVYMKHEENNIGAGFLFAITSDVHAYDDGQYLDTILKEGKFITINNKQYLVGGPLDFRMEENDPKVELYKTMVRQCADVIRSMK